MATRSKATAATNGEKLVSDLKVVLDDAEEMFQEAARTGGEKGAEIRERAQQKLQLLRDKLLDAQDVFVEKGRAAVHATDDYVHEHPWQGIAIAAGVGFVLGLLVNRR